MKRNILTATIQVPVILVFLALAGCPDQHTRTEIITTEEQDPPHMVSPGTEIVE